MLGITRHKRQKNFQPWYGLLILAVLTVAFGLKIVESFRPHPTPTATLPAVSYQEIAHEEPASPSPTVQPAPTPTPEPAPATPEPTAPPAELNLAVPFTSQAPSANWDALHEDACEEASMYMVAQFYAGTPGGKIDPTVADTEITRLVHAEEAVGLAPSISLAELESFLAVDSHTTAVIVDNPSIEGIKALIAAGKPVILPAAGRELGNPNFTGAGPLYHMLVIRGYTATTFITNDPGTRLGENYSYSTDVIMKAMGDWNDGDPEHGPKRILYIQP